ncbi:MAG TPA: hypothetical protein DDX84_03025 [Nitrospiraceae bacterium]|nr:MAG: hypothetical protein A3D21_00825 [Nitrospirae bacterium RIFCSPHIGHO2_02_FULL_42_12]HBI23187.1 hypothetical protein [Nitrospiraceae bacterium]
MEDKENSFGRGEDLEEIRDGDTFIAIIIRAKYHSPGLKFFTPSTFSQQLGFLNHKKGNIIKNHVHNPVPREVIYTQEVLFIREGKLRVDLYGNSNRFITSRILEGGDVILLAGGGHGFEILEDTSMIEVKQGPYAEVDDKRYF